MKVAAKFLLHDSLVEDINCVVSGAASGWSPPAHKPWVPDASDINTVAVVVVVAPKLPVFFGDAIHCRRLLNCVLGTSQRRVSESSDRARPEDLLHQAAASCLKAVEKRSHVDVFGIEGVPFSCCRQQSRQAVQVTYLILLDQIEEMFTVVDIHDFVMDDSGSFGWVANISADNVFSAIATGQGSKEFLSDLPIGPRK